MKCQVPIVKSGGTVEIDTDAIPQEVYEEAMLLGLKVLLNRGMSKVTKAAYPKSDELKAAASKIAEENVQKVMTGKIKFSSGASKSKVSGAVKTEAMRLARALVKDAIKASGGKISHYDASEITKAAKALLEADASILETAAANLKEREKAPVGDKLDLKSLLKVNPDKVAKAEAKAKPKAAGQLSAKQAGIPQKQKPKAPQPVAG